MQPEKIQFPTSLPFGDFRFGFCGDLALSSARGTSSSESLITSTAVLLGLGRLLPVGSALPPLFGGDFFCGVTFGERCDLGLTTANIQVYI